MWKDMRCAAIRTTFDFARIKAAFSICSSVTVFWRLYSACIPPWTKCPRLDLFSSFRWLITRLRFCTLYLIFAHSAHKSLLKDFLHFAETAESKTFSKSYHAWRRNFRTSSDYGNCFHSHFHLGGSSRNGWFAEDDDSKCCSVQPVHFSGVHNPLSLLISGSNLSFNTNLSSLLIGL